MATDRQRMLHRRIRWLLGGFVVGLVLSGLTALPLEWETELLTRWAGADPQAPPEIYTGLQQWLAKAHQGLRETNARFPFLAYGTDWLAFAHLMIAVAFLGAIRDPVRNIWVITFGMIACAGVIPTAMIFGAIRGIPFYWRVIDCAFGVVGIAPLALARYYTRQLEASSA